MKRRDFLKAGSAGLAGAVMSGTGLIAWTPRAQAATINKTFYITEGAITQPDGVNVYFRGYSASANGLDIPGEALIVQQGDSVNITIVNTLNTPHNFVIDGVVNSGTIQPGQTRSFQFSAGSPGSYLYHDTQNGEYNRLLGLYGAMAIMPSGSSNQLFRGSRTFVQQYFWVFHEVDPVWTVHSRP